MVKIFEDALAAGLIVNNPARAEEVAAAPGLVPAHVDQINEWRKNPFHKKPKRLRLGFFFVKALLE